MRNLNTIISSPVSFTEFNRISIEVLSVVAVQVKCIQDAIKVNIQIFYAFLLLCIIYRHSPLVHQHKGACLENNKKSKNNLNKTFVPIH